MTASAAVTSNSGLTRRATFGWSMWAWAEHSFPTIIQTFIFATYITSASFGSDTGQLARNLGNAGFIGGLIVALTAPIIGRRADESGRRKFWLMFNTFALVAIMIGCYFVLPDPKYFVLGVTLYTVGGVLQEIAYVNYYAMLKQVSRPSNMAKISGLSWGLGFVGGIVLLLIALVGFYLPAHPWFGVSTNHAQNIRVMFLISGLWTLIFSLPTLLWVPELPRSTATKRVTIAQSYRRLFTQLATLRRNSPSALRFLIASAIYRDGLVGIFTFGAILGSVAFGFSKTQIIFYGVGASIVAGIGATIGGFVDDKLGTKRTIVISLIGLLLAGSYVFAFASAGQITYWIGGLTLSLFVGPAQASSRTFMARLAPKNREGELFGLYQTTGEAASVLAPGLWSLALTIATAMGLAHPTLYGIIALLLILAVGLGLLLKVDPNPAEVA